ncbi:MAG: hypothetical protein IH987_19845, partial [Planctomycetes bacterium]|nr:hypothetical protein [Planctomycetota bacterium]
MKSIWLSIALVSVILVTTAVRVAPLAEGGDRLRRQCVSEDGYLMLTIARNIALGNGFSISDGEIRSNGVQPLAALIYALCFVVVGGDRLAGLYPVVGLQIVLSIMTAFMLFHAMGKYFYRGPHSQLVAILAAVAWYVSPTTVMQTQNSLETGLCALLILCAITLYDVLAPRLRRTLHPGWCIAFGVMLGVTFLGRNDACLLIAVLLGVHLALGFRNGSLGRAVRQSFIIGGASVFTALPWLCFNVSRFGHIVPV